VRRAHTGIRSEYKAPAQRRADRNCLKFFASDLK
jgi:hypothetical protein